MFQIILTRITKQRITPKENNDWLFGIANFPFFTTLMYAVYEQAICLSQLVFLFITSNLKKFTVAILFLFFTIHSYGIVITGTVKDLKDKTPLPGVLISLGDSEVHSDLDGDFIVNNSKGFGKMELSFLGYLNMVVQNIKDNCDTLHLGSIYILAPTRTFHPPRHGTEKYFYDDGSLKEVVPFKKWKLHGDYKFFLPNNELMVRLNFRKDKLTDSWFFKGDNNFEVDKNCQCLKIDLNKIKTNCNN